MSLTACPRDVSCPGTVRVQYYFPYRICGKWTDGDFPTDLVGNVLGHACCCLSFLQQAARTVLLLVAAPTCFDKQVGPSCSLLKHLQ